MSDRWIIQKRIDPIRRIWPLMFFQILILWGIIGALFLGYLHSWPIIFIPHEIDIFGTGTFTVEEYILIESSGLAVCFYMEWEALGY